MIVKAIYPRQTEVVAVNDGNTYERHVDSSGRADWEIWYAEESGSVPEDVAQKLETAYQIYIEKDEKAETDKP